MRLLFFVAEAWGWGPSDVGQLTEAELSYLHDLYIEQRRKERQQSGR